jgi:adenylate cyclase
MLGAAHSVDVAGTCQAILAPKVLDTSPCSSQNSSMRRKRRIDKPAESAAPSMLRSPEDATLKPRSLARLVARIRTLKGAIVAIAGVGALLGGLAGYWNAYQAARSSVQAASLLAIVGKGDAGPRSLVVLPFANLTGDPQQAYLADGLTSMVTADLSRIRDAFIVSATTAYSYKDKALTVQQIGKELGVRFALQGDVQRSGDKLRINAQLADATTNALLWTETFDGSQLDLFALQDQVTTRIGNSLGREMLIVAARESELRQSNPNVSDLLIRASALGLKPDSKRIRDEMEALCRHALLLEPNNVKAMVCLATTISTAAYNDWSADGVIDMKRLDEARGLAQKAKELDPDHPGIQASIAQYAGASGDYEAMRRADEIALSLSPKSPSAYSNLADDYIEAGEPVVAIELLTKGIRLDPRNVSEITLGEMGRAQFMLGDDQAAIAWLLKALDVSDRIAEHHALLAMAYARRGESAKAQASVAALLQLEPKFSLSRFDKPRPGYPSAYREFWETKLLPAARLAGLPD